MEYYAVLSIVPIHVFEKIQSQMEILFIENIFCVYEISK